MNSATSILHVEPFDVATRLKALGLSVDILSDAIRAGYQGWSSCTELDPPMYPGISMWANIVRRLRQRVLAEGWTYSDEGNYSTVLSPDGTFALAIATGDENTGNSSIQPTTQSPKGPRTISAVQVNEAQLVFGFIVSEEEDRNSQNGDDKATTWILLVHRNNTVINAELSHPLDIDDNQRISGWHERIILPIVEFSPDEEIDFNDNDEVTIDIPVLRRV